MCLLQRYLNILDLTLKTTEFWQSWYQPIHSLTRRKHNCILAIEKYVYIGSCKTIKSFLVSTKIVVPTVRVYNLWILSLGKQCKSFCFYFINSVISKWFQKTLNYWITVFSKCCAESDFSTLIEMGKLQKYGRKKFKW